MGAGAVSWRAVVLTRPTALVLASSAKAPALAQRKGFSVKYGRTVTFFNNVDLRSLSTDHSLVARLGKKFYLPDLILEEQSKVLLARLDLRILPCKSNMPVKKKIIYFWDFVF